MNETQKPIARKQDLVIQEMTDEVLVYDLKTNKAHCLNRTAAEIWKSCDGKTSVAEIAGLYKTADGTADEDMIWLALDQLSEKNLLDTDAPVKLSGQTRREIIKKVGLAAVVALPIVTSLVAPTVASAGSTCASPGCTCTLPAACAAGAGATCACNPTTGANNCPSQCTGGCSCAVANGATTCTSSCT